MLIAHPDDESYLVAGTMARNRAAGGTATVVCATDGEKGTAHLVKPLSRRALAKLRERELRAVARILRVTRLVFLRLPDGRLDTKSTTLLTRTRTILRKHPRTAIISFGPDGMTGHRDHIACYRAAIRLAREFKIPFWCVTVAPHLSKAMPNWLSKRRAHLTHYRKIGRYLPHALRIAIDPKLKLRCIKQHRSQLPRGGPYRWMPKRAMQSLLSAEYFALGWAPQNS